MKIRITTMTITISTIRKMGSTVLTMKKIKKRQKIHPFRAIMHRVLFKLEKQNVARSSFTAILIAATATMLTTRIVIIFSK